MLDRLMVTTSIYWMDGLCSSMGTRSTDSCVWADVSSRGKNEMRDPQDKMPFVALLILCSLRWSSRATGERCSQVALNYLKLSFRG